MSNFSSIFAAEIFAILSALRYNKSPRYENVVIINDSQSAVTAIEKSYDTNSAK